jgi:hypothetical protein
VIIEPDNEDHPRELEIKIISRPLLKLELNKLHINTKVPEGKKFEEVYHFETQEKNILFKLELPKDALFEDSERRDHDTRCGGLVELIIPRRKKLDKMAFRGSLYLHLDTEVQTNTPLATRLAEPANNNNNNNYSGGGANNS